MHTAIFGDTMVVLMVWVSGWVLLTPRECQGYCQQAYNVGDSRQHKDSASLNSEYCQDGENLGFLGYMGVHCSTFQLLCRHEIRS